jgi:MerR family copper efflux transcriptional regulator
MTITPDMRIGVLARLAGTSAPTIRYYEEIGLLPRATRQDGLQRRYGEDDVRRVTFIRRCREFGFSIDHVRELLMLLDDPTRRCTEVRNIAQAQLDSVRIKLVELRKLEAMLVEFVDRCATACVGAECVPLARLASRAPSKRLA